MVDYSASSPSLSDPFFFAGVTAFAIALGASHSCVLVNEGDVKCWGDNSKGQLGNWTVLKLAGPFDVSFGLGMCLT